MNTPAGDRPSGPPPAGRSPVALLALVFLGALGSLGMMLFAGQIGAIPRGIDPAWWFSAPQSWTSGWIVPHTGFYCSFVLLATAWWRLGIVARVGALTLPWAGVAGVTWATPLFIGVPLFSRDIYSYIGQSQLAASGLDPYLVAPAALGAGPVLDSIATVWHHTPSPYGPLFVLLGHVVFLLGGKSVISEVLAFRALELVGLVIAGWAIAALARHQGHDPGLALWLGLLSPLALFSFVSSAHNDALMIGLLLVGLLLGTRGHLAWGIALCSLGATVKLPALAGVVFLVVPALTGVPAGRKAQVILEAVGIPAAVFFGVTEVAGYGWTWLGLRTYRIPTELKVLITPVISLSRWLHGLLHAVGLPVGEGVVTGVVELLAALAVAAGCLALLLRARRDPVVPLLALALLLVAVASPTVWPWYYTWGLCLAATTAAQRSRALALLALGAMLLVGAGGTPMLNGGAYWVTGPLVVAAVVYLARKRRWTFGIPIPWADLAADVSSPAEDLGGIHAR